MIDINRKGARSIKDIPPHILTALNRGEIESVNLMEYLATDRRLLLENILQELGREQYLQPCLSAIEALPKQTSSMVNRAIGTTLLCFDDEELFNALAKYKSDIVRSWATYIVGNNGEITITDMLLQIAPFATDNHFNVREEAWSAVRWKIAANLENSIKILTQWSISEDENIRRFASEATRPRGVWCPHITPLKEKPELALSILEPLKSDTSKYVRDSVGNWLNDASKSRPDFVQSLCDRWLVESNIRETNYIVKKALRTLVKQT